MKNTLFNTHRLGENTLNNRVVMAPLTRNRAVGNQPNEIMAKYYGQRATAGLIITEGVAPSPNGAGYPRMPGIWNETQKEGWKAVADSVHAEGGKIFMQIMHSGRVSHAVNMEEGTKILAPSAIQAEGVMFTDSDGELPLPVPVEMTKTDIDQAIEEYVEASKRAIEAGFDGVEIHGANGYLLDQFFNGDTNQRSDEYGGSKENRAKFPLEITQKVVEAIGADKVGYRMSPYGTFNDQGIFEGIEDSLIYLIEQLDSLGIAYLHIADLSHFNDAELPVGIKEKIRRAFEGTLMLNGNYNKERATKAIEGQNAELISFGVPFIANPDLVKRLEMDAELNAPDMTKFYTPGEEGYTDYPTLEESKVALN